MTSTTDGRRGPYAKTEQFRLDVLDAALGLVAAHGFDAATLQLIADEVGRSKAGLLHHFGSRDALLLAAALPITAWPGLNEPDDDDREEAQP